MTKNNNRRTIIWLMIVGLAITTGGIIWAMGGQNQKLETVSTEQSLLRVKAEKHDTDISGMQTDIQWIRGGIERIEEKL